MPHCVNPAHMEPVTQAENVQRGRVSEANRARNAAITHCPHGHEYTPENTRMIKLKTGYMARACRTCERIRNRVAAAKRKAARDNIQIT